MLGLRSARGQAILAGIVLVLLLVAVGAVAVWRTRQTEQWLQDLDRTSSAATALEGGQANFWWAQGALSALVISGDPTYVSIYDNAFAGAESDLAEARAQFLALGKTAEVSAVDDLTRRIGEFNARVRPTFDILVQAEPQAVFQLANATMSEMKAQTDSIISDWQTMVRDAQREASAELQAADQASEATLWLLLGLSGVALATGIGTMVILVRSVVRPLAALRASASAIASGDSEARARVSGPEEVASLARDFNEMTDALAAKTEAVRESEKRYRLLADNASDIIWTMDMSLHLTYESPSVTRIRGYSPEEAMAQTIEETLTPASLEVAMKALAEELAVEQLEQKDLSRSRTLELEHTCKDGSTVWLEVTMTFLRDEDGRAVGLLGASRDVTERKRAEGAILRAKEEWERTFDAVPDLIAIIDENYHIVRANRAMAERLKVTPDECVGKVCYEVVHGLGRPPEFCPHTPSLADGRDHAAEVNEPRLGGKFLVSVTPLADAQGRRVGSVHVARDITERKRAEEALRESEARYKALFAGAPVGMLVADSQTKQFRYANPVACRMFGYTEEEFLRIGVAAIHPEESLDQVLADFEAQGRGEKLLSPGLPCLRKDGTLIYVDISSIAIVLDGHKCSVGTFTDITERKRAEEELRESEERFRLLFENAKDAIFHADPGTGLITKCNRAAETLLEKDQEEIVGQPQTIIHPPQEAERYTQMFKHHLEEQGFAEDEAEVMTKSGKTKPVLITASVVSVRGTPIIQGVFRDITERKRAEEERERLHAELELRAITDGLTGLYNHAFFYERLSEEIERSQRYNGGFAVAMMDVDNFKHFNDSCGHQQGDEMLRIVADSIRSGLRRSDLAFRYGGDEFAAIMLHADAARARTVIDRINRHLARSLKQMNHAAAARLSLSAGVACFGDDGRTADELVRVADAALYGAKWAAQTRHVVGCEYAIESLAPPPAMAANATLSTAASCLAAALREFGVPDVMAEMNLRTIAALGTLAEIKDPYVRGHQERTSDVAATLAEKMGLSPDRVRGTRLAGLVHDLGKAGISKRILIKPGKLTEEEFAEVKEHPPLGSMMIISEVEALQQLVPIVRHHHERFDGKGYPDGLTGDEIPLEARILAVVDAFDAMTHERSYRKALSREKALAEVKRCAGTQFDPAVVDVFLAWAAKEDRARPARRQPVNEDKELAAVPTTRA
jgi:diguanylate cyclase (GGDEF)-like protein/PAS domain S-box-containing protein